MKTKAPTTAAPSSAAVALRSAAAELERQAAILRAKADRLDGAAAVTVKLTKAKAPAKKAAKRKASKAARKATRKSARRPSPAKAKSAPAKRGR